MPPSCRPNEECVHRSFDVVRRRVATPANGDAAVAAAASAASSSAAADGRSDSLRGRNNRDGYGRRVRGRILTKVNFRVVRNRRSGGLVQ